VPHRAVHPRLDLAAPHAHLHVAAAQAAVEAGVLEARGQRVDGVVRHTRIGEPLEVAW